MAFPDRRTVDILLTTALLTAIGVAVYCARRVILMFVLAILFSYLIDPVVKFLQRHSLFFRNLRGPAVVEVYLTFVLLIALAGYMFAPSLARSTTRVLDEAPVFLNSLSTGDIASDLRGKYGWSEAQELRFRAFLAAQRVFRVLYQQSIAILQTLRKCSGTLLFIPAAFSCMTVTASMFFIDCSSYRSACEDSALVGQLLLMLTQYIRAQLCCVCSLSCSIQQLCLSCVFFAAPHHIWDLR
jgi:predicted PurR-regulated permease PerM